jgi:mitochondrial chaperone BCS1
MSSLPEHCVAVMEDIDVAFTHGVARKTTGGEPEDPHIRNLPEKDREGAEAARREAQGLPPGQSPDDLPGAKELRVTLSGLLNALDGISAQEGRLLFATTNRYHTLDPALIRPGRMDLHVEFRLTSRYQAKILYKHFYAPDPPKKASEGGEEDGTLMVPGSVVPTKEDSGSALTLSNDDGYNEAPKYDGIAHSARAPELSKEELERLASEFSSRIPERELSMASLQEYLMTYKVRPFQAVDDVEQWVKETREKQDLRAEARAAGARA